MTHAARHLPQPARADRPVVLVTGASRGIGGALFALLAADDRVGGVVGLSRTPPPKAFDVRRALHVCGEVAEQSAAARAVQSAIDVFGRLDALINAAGVRPATPISSTDNSAWIETISVNLVGACFCIRAALPELIRRRGRIVNLHSGEATNCSPGYSAYSAAKAGLESMTRSLARELARPGVRVYGYQPGNVATAMNPTGYRPPEAAAADLRDIVLNDSAPTGTVFLPKEPLELCSEDSPEELLMR